MFDVRFGGGYGGRMSDVASPRIDLAQYGAYAALGRELGITRSTVWEWFRDGGRVPAERVVEVERLTGIPRERLRPDLYERPGDAA